MVQLADFKSVSQSFIQSSQRSAHRIGADVLVCLILVLLHLLSDFIVFLPDLIERLQEVQLNIRTLVQHHLSQTLDLLNFFDLLSELICQTFECEF